MHVVRERRAEGERRGILDEAGDDADALLGPERDDRPSAGLAQTKVGARHRASCELERSRVSERGQGADRGDAPIDVAGRRRLEEGIDGPQIPDPTEQARRFDGHFLARELVERRALRRARHQGEARGVSRRPLADREPVERLDGAHVLGARERERGDAAREVATTVHVARIVVLVAGRSRALLVVLVVLAFVVVVLDRRAAAQETKQAEARAVSVGVGGERPRDGERLARGRRVVRPSREERNGLGGAERGEPRDPSQGGVARRVEELRRAIHADTFAEARRALGRRLRLRFGAHRRRARRDADGLRGGDGREQHADGSCDRRARVRRAPHSGDGDVRGVSGAG